jgi:hypothetical protein
VIDIIARVVAFPKSSGRSARVICVAWIVALVKALTSATARIVTLSHPRIKALPWINIRLIVAIAGATTRIVAVAQSLRVTRVVAFVKVLASATARIVALSHPRIEAPPWIDVGLVIAVARWIEALPGVNTTWIIALRHPWIKAAPRIDVRLVVAVTWTATWIEALSGIYI